MLFAAFRESSQTTSMRPFGTLAMVSRIVVDSLRCAKGCTAIGAAREHYVRWVKATSRRIRACQHVNVVVRGGAGTVNRYKGLPGESTGIYVAAENDAAAQIDSGNLIKSRSDVRVLCIGRTNTPKLAAYSSAAADKKVTVSGHVERSPLRKVRNADRRLPSCPAVGGSVESAKVTSGALGPKLVLKAVAHAGRGPIDGEPLLVAAVRVSIG